MCGGGERGEKGTGQKEGGEGRGGELGRKVGRGRKRRGGKRVAKRTESSVSSFKQNQPGGKDESRGPCLLDPILHIIHFTA